MTGIKSQTSILAHFRLLAWELPVLEGLIDFGKCCPDDSGFIFYWIFIRLANLGWVWFWGRSDYSHGENVVQTIVTPFFIRSSSNMQITRTSIKSLTSLVLAHFWLLARELSTFEGLIDLEQCWDDSNFIFDQIFIRLAGNKDSHKTILEPYKNCVNYVPGLTLTYFMTRSKLAPNVKGQGHSMILAQGHHDWLSIKITNIYSSETTGPIRVRFYIEHLSLMGTKVYIIGPGHMTKMANMPIYGKTPLKIFFSRTIVRWLWNLNRQQKGPEPYKSYINDDPGLTLTYLRQGQICSLRLLNGKRVKQCIHPKQLRFMK